MATRDCTEEGSEQEKRCEVNSSTCGTKQLQHHPSSMGRSQVTGEGVEVTLQSRSCRERLIFAAVMVCAKDSLSFYRFVEHH